MPTMQLTKKQAKTLRRLVKSYLMAEGQEGDPLAQELVKRENESKEKATSKKRKSKKSKKTF